MSSLTNWPSWQAFLEMGGYGLYVWGSVLVTLLALLIESWSVRQSHMRALQHIRHKQFIQSKESQA